MKKTICVVICLLILMWTAPAYAASQRGKTVQVGDRDLDHFGAQDLFEGMYRFRVEGDWVYTWYHDHRQEAYKFAPARVNILTKEFEILK